MAHRREAPCRGLGSLAAIGLVLSLGAAGCPGPREVPARYRARPDAAPAPEPAAAAAPRDAAPAAPRDAAPARRHDGGGDGPRDAGPGHRYDRQLPLEGTVDFSLAGTCTGCTAGELAAEARLSGDELSITGEPRGCEGACAARRAVTGSVTVKALRPRTYRVRSNVDVVAVTPRSLSSAKRTAWVLFLMRERCAEGLAACTGDEQVTPELRETFGRCLAEAPPEVKHETIAAMMSWKNGRAFVPALVDALEDEGVAFLAARALGRLEDDRAVDPLIEALASPDESLRWDAARSLEMITGEGLGQDQARWKAWRSGRGAR